MNLVVLRGNLTRDPELRPVGDSQVVNFGIAVNKRYKKANGEVAERTNFFDCEAWDSGAKLINELLSKGDSVLVNGSLENDSWEKDGQKFTKTKIRVQNFEKQGRRVNSQESTEDSVDSEPVSAGVGGEDIPF